MSKTVEYYKLMHTVDYDKLMHFLMENRNTCERNAKDAAEKKNYMDALTNDHEASIYDGLIEILQDVNNEMGYGLVTLEVE